MDVTGIYFTFKYTFRAIYSEFIATSPKLRVCLSCCQWLEERLKSPQCVSNYTWAHVLHSSAKKNCKTKYSSAADLNVRRRAQSVCTVDNYAHTHTHTDTHHHRLQSLSFLPVSESHMKAALKAAVCALLSCSHSSKKKKRKKSEPRTLGGIKSFPARNFKLFCLFLRF